MNKLDIKRSSALTLVEVMLSVALLAIIAVGTMNYQFYAAKHARMAQAEMAATRIAQLLLEDWKSIGGDKNYDPATLNLGFTTVSETNNPDYMIIDNALPLYVDLAYNDIATDPQAGVTLREISITVRWRRDFSEGVIGSDDPELILTTFTRLDQKNG